MLFAGSCQGKIEELSYLCLSGKSPSTRISEGVVALRDPAFWGCETLVRSGGQDQGKIRTSKLFFLK